MEWSEMEMTGKGLIGVKEQRLGNGHIKFCAKYIVLIDNRHA